MYFGDRIKLFPLTKDDLDDLMKHWNDLELRKFLVSSIPNTRREEEDWIENAYKQKQKGKAYHFSIRSLDGKFIGTCGLGSINRMNRSAGLGIAITNKEEWNKGYGTEAMKVLLAFGFNIINLHRIELEVHKFNKRAIRVYEKVGFKQVGEKRDAYFIRGEYINSYIMDILQSEFNEKYPDFDMSKPSKTDHT